MKAKPISCIGQIVADILVLPVDRYPNGGKLEYVSEITIQCGGCALNTAMALSQLGVSVQMQGKVGKDLFGEALLNMLQEFSVETSAVRVDPETKTSSVIILVSSSGERSFLYSAGGTERLCIDDLDFDAIANSSIVHIGGIMKLDNLCCEEVLRYTKDAGVTTCIDTDFVIGKGPEFLEPCFQYADIFMCNLDEGMSITGQANPENIAEFFLARGANTVVVKRGSNGCYLRTKNLSEYIPTHKVKAVDTTGAGDCFCAGYLAGINLGWDAIKSAQFGNACGAKSATAVGATAGIGSFEVTMEFMQKTPLRIGQNK